jgi:hypothetical protein
VSDNKKSPKKDNILKFSECREILERLENHKESKYYKEVLRQFESLLPKSGPHVPKKSD